ncbi:MAG: response regulator [Rhodopirellula sp.]|nr:response regulator [Rhodopirellula sp.]
MECGGKNRPQLTSYRIVVAEDDDEMRSLVALTLRQDGYEVVECSNGIELLAELRKPSESGDVVIDLVVSDVHMPGISGLAVLQGLAQGNKSPRMILITAFGDSETHVEAQRLGAVACLDKPFDMEVLMGLVHGVVPRAGPMTER